jgi:hypothetical protein
MQMSPASSAGKRAPAPLALGVIGLGLAGSVMAHAAALHPRIRLASFG